MIMDGNVDVDLSPPLTTIKGVAEKVHEIAKAKGFYDGEEELLDESMIARRLAMIHTEVSEATEELRNKNFDKHKFAEELADIILRTLDLAVYMEIAIDIAIDNKLNVMSAKPRRTDKLF